MDIQQAKKDFSNPTLGSNYDWNSNEVFWQSSKDPDIWFGAKNVGESGNVVPDWNTLHEFVPAGL